LAPLAEYPARRAASAPPTLQAIAWQKASCREVRRGRVEPACRGLTAGAISVEAGAGVSMELAFGWIGLCYGFLSYSIEVGKLKIGVPGS
jgi:hypothetical protein